MLNLTEVFRAHLQTTRTYVPLAEELDIVRAYLEIEALLLGDRLTTEIVVDDHLTSVIIPALIIRPLVENAIRHGMSADGTGFVQLTIADVAGCLHVAVLDKGAGFSDHSSEHTGVGLDNVRKRLKLCYRADTDLEIDSSRSGAVVSFLVSNTRARRSDAPVVECEASIKIEAGWYLGI
ncbi:MAG: histidine kinase [Acidobacteriota bacterium]|nr:histidine kinase [Acidobacteriota bacterium]